MIMYILQNAVFCILYTLGFLAGGISSAANAADVQNDYYDPSEALITCANLPDNAPDQVVENCDDIRRIRDSQAAAAVSA